MAKQDKLAALQQRMQYAFSDCSLLETALTHTSFVKGDGKDGKHNERLEFLGDAVLELCVSEYLYNHFPARNEGAMTRARAMTVCEASLFEAARAISLPECIRLGHGEETTGGRDKPSIVSDAFEAVIGAVFLDGGIDAARSFILRFLEEPIKTAMHTQNQKDYKTTLQEYVQKKHMGNISYALISALGPDHKKTFRMKVMIDRDTYGEGEGPSKQEAGQMAAQAALQRLLDDAGERTVQSSCD